MRLVVNGEPRTVADGATVLALLRALGPGEVRVAVEVNRHVVLRAQHESHRLEDGDTVEIVHFVGGG
jgi:thiamine biosynthesis protein ThiS